MAEKTGFFKRLSAWVARRQALFFTIFYVLTGLFFIVSLLVIRTSVWTILRALAFSVFGLLLPGYLLARHVIRKGQPSELYAFSLLFGFALSIALYFVDSAVAMPVLPGRFFSLVTGPVLSVPGALFLRRDLRSGKLDRASLLPRHDLLVLLSVSMLIMYCSAALQSGISAELVGVETAYHDMLWNIGNTASLSHGWPADNMQYVGKHLNSNIFANIFRVTASRFIGSTAAETMFVFSGFYYIPLLIFSLDALAMSYLNDNKRRSSLYIFVFLFVGYLSRAFMSYFQLKQAYSLAYVAYVLIGVSNLLYVPNGIDLAVPAVALLALLVVKVYRKKKISVVDAAAIFVTAAVLSGAKYVFTVCMIGALVGTLLLRLLQGKGTRRFSLVLTSLVMIGLGFALSFFGVVSGGEVYAPATVLSPTYHDPYRREYRQAREEYLTELDAKNYQYLLVTDTVDPLVREIYSGAYYVGGRSLSAQNVSESRVMNMLRYSRLDTTGVIGGAGGENDLYLSDFSYVTHAYGFIRFRVAGQQTTRVLFYGKNIAASDASRTNAHVLQLFRYGSDGTEFSYEASYSSLNINAAAKSTELYKWMLSNVSSGKAVQLVYLLAFIPILFVLARPVTAVPFLLWTGGKIRRYKEIKLEDMLICGTAICGLIAYFLLDINGFSQVYFILTALVFTDLIGVRWLGENYKRIGGFDKFLLWLLALLGLCTYVSLYGYQSGRGVVRLSQVYTQTYAGIQPGGDRITSYEAEAMRWLRENSPEDALVAYNRHHKDLDTQATERPIPNDYSARYYYYTAFSERQAFLGAWAYMPRTVEMQDMLEQRLVVNAALFDPFCSNKRELMEAHGISYLVASEYVGFGTDMTDPDLKVVFRNRDIVIYALNDNV